MTTDAVEEKPKVEEEGFVKVPKKVYTQTTVYLARFAFACIGQDEEQMKKIIEELPTVLTDLNNCLKK